MDPTNEPQTQPETPAPVQPAAAPVITPVSGTGSGFAIAALVLGIISFLFSWLNLLNLPASILAIVFGIVALNKKQSKGMALTGLILGGIGLVFSIGWLIFGIIASSSK